MSSFPSKRVMVSGQILVYLFLSDLMTGRKINFDLKREVKKSVSSFAFIV